MLLQPTEVSRTLAGLPALFSYTHRPVRSGAHGPAGSRVGNQIPQNSSVWVSLKMGSRPPTTRNGPRRPRGLGDAAAHPPGGGGGPPGRPRAAYPIPQVAYPTPRAAYPTPRPPVPDPQPAYPTPQPTYPIPPAPIGTPPSRPTPYRRRRFPELSSPPGLATICFGQSPARGQTRLQGRTHPPPPFLPPQTKAHEAHKVPRPGNPPLPNYTDTGRPASPKPTLHTATGPPRPAAPARKYRARGPRAPHGSAPSGGVGEPSRRLPPPSPADLPYTPPGAAAPSRPTLHPRPPTKHHPPAPASPSRLTLYPPPPRPAQRTAGPSPDSLPYTPPPTPNSRPLPGSLPYTRPPPSNSHPAPANLPYTRPAPSTQRTWAPPRPLRGPPPADLPYSPPPTHTTTPASPNSPAPQPTYPIPAPAEARQRRPHQRVPDSPNHTSPKSSP